MTNRPRATKSVPLLSAADLEFLLYDWLDVCALVERPYYAEHSRETFDDVLSLARELAERHFAGHAALGDTNEPTVVDGKVKLTPEVGPALDRLRDSGLMRAAADESLGGLPAATGCPSGGADVARSRQCR